MLDPNVYTTVREVGVRKFRGELRKWLDHARRGGEIIVTDRGHPVARIIAPGRASKMDELAAAGLITLPSKPKTPVVKPGVRARGSVAELVREQRR